MEKGNIRLFLFHSMIVGELDDGVDVDTYVDGNDGGCEAAPRPGLCGVHSV
jgi:hypothetical protein